MDEANRHQAGPEHLVIGITANGMEIRGTLVHLARFEAAIEIYTPVVVLRTSEVLTEFKILLNDRPLYSGRAVVHSVVQTGAMLVCQLQLDEGWLDADLGMWQTGPGNLQGAFSEFIRGWQKVYKVRPEFKCAVADLQAFLGNLRLWLEQWELAIRSHPAADRLKLEQDVANELGQMTTPAITNLFEVFQDAGDKVEEEYLPVHRNFCRKQLHPLLLCSPFLYRTFAKPLGYAGDYEMVNMIMRDPLEGGSLFAKLVNLWFLKQPPAEAHRNRIGYLSSEITEATLRARQAGKVARIFSLGCGPAHEVQHFLRDAAVADGAVFTLVDFNEETLAHARGQLQELSARYNRRTEIRLMKKSVNQLLKDSARSTNRSPETQFDLVYCAGLFDYLTDSICRRLGQVLYESVAPGGKLIATNVDKSNPRKGIMDLIMEWHLIYRNGAEMKGLRPDGLALEQCRVASDTTGVNVYFEMRRPEHG